MRGFFFMFFFLNWLWQCALRDSQAQLQMLEEERSFLMPLFTVMPTAATPTPSWAMPRTPWLNLPSASDGSTPPATCDAPVSTLHALACSLARPSPPNHKPMELQPQTRSPTPASSRTKLKYQAWRTITSLYLCLQSRKRKTDSLLCQQNLQRSLWGWMDRCLKAQSCHCYPKAKSPASIQPL